MAGVTARAPHVSFRKVLCGLSRLSWQICGFWLPGQAAWRRLWWWWCGFLLWIFFPNRNNHKEKYTFVSERFVCGGIRSEMLPRCRYLAWFTVLVVTSLSDSLPNVSYSVIGMWSVKIFLTSESVLPSGLSDSKNCFDFMMLEMSMFCFFLFVYL